MMPEFTVKEYAAKERVTTRTVRTWMSKGAITFRHTPGGRVRIIEPGSSRAVVFSMKDEEARGSSSE